ncbi:MAG: kelch repeat-containing protein [Myxococcota bacterium]
MLWLALSMACDSGETTPGGDAFTLELDVQTAPNQTDLFNDIDRLDLIIEYPTGSEVFTLSSASEGTSAEIVGIDPLDEVSVALAGYDGDDALVAFGRSAELTLDDGEVSATILLLRSDDFAWLEMPIQNVKGAAVSTEDGRFWLSGGIDDTRGLLSSESDTLDGIWQLSVTASDFTFNNAGFSLPSLSEESSNDGSSTDVSGRVGHSMTLLDDGQVLIVGGSGAFLDGELTSREGYLWDPATETIQNIGSRPALTHYVAGHRAVKIASGNVVFTGGFGRVPEPDFYTLTDELMFFDASSAEFSGFESVNSGSGGAAIAAFGNQGALICGGFSTDFGGDFVLAEAGCDIVGLEGGLEDGPILPARISRLYASLTPLDDGRVLLAGGYPLDEGTEISFDPDITFTASNQAYIYDGDSWTEVRPMNNPRAVHGAAPLPDGRVLVVGGFTTMTGLFDYLDLTALPCAEIFDPSSESWETVGPEDCDEDSTEGALPVAVGDPTIAFDDQYGVLVMGGLNARGEPVSNAALLVGAPDLD